MVYFCDTYYVGEIMDLGKFVGLTNRKGDSNI